jgi:hypothetical protein
VDGDFLILWQRYGHNGIAVWKLRRPHPGHYPSLRGSFRQQGSGDESDGAAKVYFFISNRRDVDQVPVFPEASLARARHHRVLVGSVLVLNCEAVSV